METTEMSTRWEAVEEHKLVSQCLQSVTPEKKKGKAPVYQRKTAVLEEWYMCGKIALQF